jgi:hypothetical protein
MARPIMATAPRAASPGGASSVEKAPQMTTTHAAAPATTPGMPRRRRRKHSLRVLIGGYSPSRALISVMSAFGSSHMEGYSPYQR